MNELQKLKEENEYLKAKIGSLELHEDFPIPLEKKRQHESSISEGNQPIDEDDRKETQLWA